MITGGSNSNLDRARLVPSAELFTFVSRCGAPMLPAELSTSLQNGTSTSALFGAAPAPSWSRTKRPFGGALPLHADGRAGVFFHDVQAEPTEPQITTSPAPAPAPPSRGALPNEALGESKG